MNASALVSGSVRVRQKAENGLKRGSTSLTSLPSPFQTVFRAAKDWTNCAADCATDAMQTIGADVLLSRSGRLTRLSTQIPPPDQRFYSMAAKNYALRRDLQVPHGSCSHYCTSNFAPAP